MVENAITHGMRWMETKQLHIVIILEKQNDYIELTISDDGVGILKEQLTKIATRLNSHSDDGHIGLYTCNKCLCLTFGEECGIRIEGHEGRFVPTLLFYHAAIRSVVLLPCGSSTRFASFLLQVS